MEARAGVIVLLCWIGFTCEELVEFTHCTSSGEVYSVEVVPCNTEPCRLHSGHNYTVSVTFTSAVKSKTSKAVVHGVISGVPVPWPIPQENGCKSGLRCPIQKKRRYTCVGILPVKPEYPTIRLKMKWELRDNHYKDLFCIMLPVQTEMIKQPLTFFQRDSA